MEVSEAGSPIYVFTDAPASDEHRINEARSLILRKNVRVSFALVNAGFKKRSLDNQQKPYQIKPRNRRQVGDDVYEQLAALSGGQFLSVRTSEISELAALVSFSAVRSRRSIFRRSDVLRGTVEHSIPVDSSVFDVTISINGQGISVTVLTPQGQVQLFWW